MAEEKYDLIHSTQWMLAILTHLKANIFKGFWAISQEPALSWSHRWKLRISSDYPLYVAFRNRLFLPWSVRLFFRLDLNSKNSRRLCLSNSPKNQFFQSDWYQVAIFELKYRWMEYIYRSSSSCGYHFALAIFSQTLRLPQFLIRFLPFAIRCCHFQCVTQSTALSMWHTLTLVSFDGWLCTCVMELNMFAVLYKFIYVWYVYVWHRYNICII